MLKTLIQRNKIILVTILFLIGIVFLSINPADNRNNVPSSLLYEIEPHPELLVDSLTPYSKFKVIKDSLEKIKIWKLGRLSYGEGWYAFLFGVTKKFECDNYHEPEFEKKESNSDCTNKHFLELKNYTLDNDASFFIDKNKYYIKYTVWDEIYENTASEHTEIKEIPVRFASGFEKYHRPDNSLLIPISKKTYVVLDILLKILLIPLILFLLWAIILLPCNTLYNIALGKSFTIQNIKNLRFTGWTLIIFIVSPIFSSFITKLIMGSKIPKEIYFPVWLYLNDTKGWLIAGAAFLILSLAFKSGYKLQQEQDLTV